MLFLSAKLLLITIYIDQTKKQNIIHFVLSSLNILHNNIDFVKRGRDFLNSDNRN